MPDAARRWLKALLWSVAGLLVFWSRGYAVSGGNDLWWHLATGRLVLEGRGVPIVDPWSFTTTGRAWIVDSWLSDVLLYQWSDLFGVMSLVWWKWSVLVATFLVLMRLLWRVTESPLLAWFFACFAAVTAAPFLDMRPQMHSLLCLAILLDATVKRERPSWLLPILFVFWVNLHAGFALGLLLLPLLLWPSLARPSSRGRALALILTCAATCLVNPNGYRAFTQPAIYALQSNSPFQTLSEWVSPFGPRAIEAAAYPYALTLVGLAFVYQLVRGVRKQQIPLVAMGLALLTAAMSLRSQKFISFFAIASSLLLAQTLAPHVRRLLTRVPSIPAALGAIVLGALLLAPYPQRPYAFHYLASEYMLPIETVNFIEKNTLTGEVFSYYQWGGYLDYRTRGRFSVYIDGRASAVFDSQTFTEYTRVLRMQPGWQQMVNDSQANYLLWPLAEPTHVRALLESRIWQVLYSDSVSILLVRSGHAPAAGLLPTDESAHKDLARGRQEGEQGRHARAREYFESALEKVPHEARACGLLAHACASSGDVDEGWKTVERCERIFPGFGAEEAYRQRLRLLESAGR